MREFGQVSVGIAAVIGIMTNLGSETEPPRLLDMFLDIFALTVCTLSVLLDALAAAAW